MHVRSGVARTAVARCLPSVRPSVCPSARRRYCVKTTKLVIIFFTTGYTILVFLYQTWQYSDGNPPNGGVECRGMKKLRFSTNISLYLGTGARYMAVIWNANRNSYAIYRIVSFPLILNDP